MVRGLRLRDNHHARIARRFMPDQLDEPHAATGDGTQRGAWAGSVH